MISVILQSKFMEVQKLKANLASFATSEHALELSLYPFL